MKSTTILAIHRLAATLDVETARIEAGAGEHKIDDTITLTGGITLGKDFVSEDTNTSWQTVVGVLLASLEPSTRKNIRKKLLSAIESGELAKLDVGRAKIARNNMRKSVARVKGNRHMAGKITGEIKVS